MTLLGSSSYRQPPSDSKLLFLVLMETTYHPLHKAPEKHKRHTYKMMTSKIVVSDRNPHTSQMTRTRHFILWQQTWALHALGTLAPGTSIVFVGVTSGAAR